MNCISLTKLALYLILVRLRSSVGAGSGSGLILHQIAMKTLLQNLENRPLRGDSKKEAHRPGPVLDRVGGIHYGYGQENHLYYPVTAYTVILCIVTYIIATTALFIRK